ncbi:PAB-dependent poly(A)-specific ribonuclease subunit PAN3 [Paramicrosporidium saccamoebae]|uniref:PAB-dependent poly(A)-specific ribonuclease subunit PAN3 n=1 Tax=Paramicrosporidium saccamoebae TaxID=1246581 RepID=A0A2H9TJ62_9FUNG|nr:PAB-dependent poly(A)-specific ribonuclease subunit PAN3 [Paramicrosporidium saccamoebae]
MSLDELLDAELSRLLNIQDQILGVPDWPDDLHGYRDFLPLAGQDIFDTTLNLPKSLAENRVTSAKSRKISKNGIYLLNVIHSTLASDLSNVGIEIDDGSVFAAVDAYRRFESPFIARFVEAFSTRQLGGSDLVTVYEASPGAVKLERASRLLKSDRLDTHIQNWIGQLLWMLHSVHRAGLCMDKILCMENIVLPTSMERIISKDYGYLCEIIDNLVARVSTRSDVLVWVETLMKALPPVWEYSHASLGNVLMGFGIFDDVMMTLHRYAHDQNWSETGDRYVLKLFRDFVFHSQDENGRPIIDMSHVISSLNKIDAATDEPIMLISRNGDQCIFATFAEIRQKLEQAYSELVGS